ncbi:TrmH family RNA methyltransferase, partial [candidate division KSB1 bacterium]
VIGTTSKSRKVNHDFYPCDSIPLLLSRKKKSIRNLALVFGSEKYGLENTILEQCDIVTYIPMKSDYPSLSLSQSVMIYAYILSRITKPEKEEKLIQQDNQSYKLLKEKVDHLLDMSGIKKNRNLYNRINERLVAFQDEDIHLLHSLCNALIDKLSDQST